LFLFEANIDAVARGPFDFADDGALLMREAIDEGALAGVAFADDGELERLFLRGGNRPIIGRQRPANQT
jgi:hypothetical protein